MQVTVVKEFTFEAAHRLPEYDGPCAFTHGHSYRLQIGVRGKVDKETGMVLDFSSLKELVNNRLAGLDHSLLNHIALPGFPRHMPTAENMVIWIVKRLQWAVERNFFGCVISFVRLYETATSYAEWRRGHNIRFVGDHQEGDTNT